MADYERIRRVLKIEGQTQRQAAEALGHSRHPIAKALAYSSPTGYRRQKPPLVPCLKNSKQTSFTARAQASQST